MFAPPALQRCGTGCQIGSCVVEASGDYFYGKVNITAGGVLNFKEGASTDTNLATNFWAKSIIIENGGAMKPVSTATSLTVPTSIPYGTKIGYYGDKVLAVGYGGTLQLRGYKGTTGPTPKNGGGPDGFGDQLNPPRRQR